VRGRRANSLKKLSGFVQQLTAQGASMVWAQRRAPRPPALAPPPPPPPPPKPKKLLFGTARPRPSPPARPDPNPNLILMASAGAQVRRARRGRPGRGQQRGAAARVRVPAQQAVRRRRLGRELPILPGQGAAGPSLPDPPRSQQSLHGDGRGRRAGYQGIPRSTMPLESSGVNCANVHEAWRGVTSSQEALDATPKTAQRSCPPAAAGGRRRLAGGRQGPRPGRPHA